MPGWYSRVIADPDNFLPVADAIEFFDGQYDQARKEIKPYGRLEETELKLPGWVEHRFGQLQEIEAIMSHLERKKLRLKTERKRHFLEHYQRDISEKLAGEYAEIDPDVVVIAELIDQVALVRNKFLSLTKGLEYLHFQLGNITKLRVAGIEDATIEPPRF